MAGPLKKRNIDDENQSGSENQDQNDFEEEVIETDFEGRCPEIPDFHGVKKLLNQLFLKANLDLSGLADIIVAQNNVGSVLKQSAGDEGDDSDDEVDINEVFGITSVINISDKKDLPCIDQLRNFLIESSSPKTSHKLENPVQSVLHDNSSHVGFLLNERFINIPAQISEPLFEALRDEISRADAKKFQFHFENYILISKIHKSINDNSVYFVNREEELFDKIATYKFDYSVKNECDSGVSGEWMEDDEVLIPYRRIMLLPAKEFCTTIDNIKTFVSNIA